MRSIIIKAFDNADGKTARFIMGIFLGFGIGYFTACILRGLIMRGLI